MVVVETRLVICTFPDEVGALRAARSLVRRRLAACVQVLGPIHSVYRWRGKVKESAEWLCLAKTTAARYPRLEAALLRLHPYDTPEVVALPLAEGHSRYLKWLARSVAPARRRA